MKISKSDPELETIVSRIRRKELDLQPNFQRGEIWDKKRRQRLVDSILRGWYIPAVHIVRSEEGPDVVLDGQQRLAAIRDFFDDKVEIDGMIEPHDPKILALDGMRHSELPAEIKREVNRFVLQCNNLYEHKPQEPNELFFRLNQSYNLTPPEKRNALHGKARDQVKRLVEELVDIGLLKQERVGFSNGRLAYDDIIARACVAIEMGTLKRHINNNVVEEKYRSGEQFQEATVDGIRNSGKKLLAQIEDGPGRVRFNKGTLQTWLVYAYWSSKLGMFPAGLLAEFEADRHIVKDGDVPTAPHLQNAIVEVIRMYDDRASYRVTDVSSVVIRDLSLHLYSVARFGIRPLLNSDILLAEMQESPDSSKNLVSKYLKNEEWGSISGPEEDHDASR